MADSLLTADQVDALAAGRPLRMRFAIRRPRSSAHSTYDDIEFDEGLHGELKRVIDPGRRKFSAINFSAMKQDKMRPATYEIECSNSDGYFNPSGTNTIWYYATTPYTALAKECYLVHSVWIKLLDGSWDELDAISYVGKIRDVSYTVRFPAAGVLASGGTVVISSEAEVSEFLRTVWKKEHGTHTQVTDTTSGDAYVPL